jgi:hypothetical protein
LDGIDFQEIALQTVQEIESYDVAIRNITDRNIAASQHRNGDSAEIAFRIDA